MVEIGKYLMNKAFCIAVYKFSKHNGLYFLPYVGKGYQFSIFSDYTELSVPTYTGLECVELEIVVMSYLNYYH